jgi:hypothetical protein
VYKIKINVLEEQNCKSKKHIRTKIYIKIVGKNVVEIVDKKSLKKSSIEKVDAKNLPKSCQKLIPKSSEN